MDVFYLGNGGSSYSRNKFNKNVSQIDIKKTSNARQTRNATYPKKDREAFRQALVSIIMYVYVRSSQVSQKFMEKAPRRVLV